MGAINDSAEEDSGKKKKKSKKKKNRTQRKSESDFEDNSKTPLKALVGSADDMSGPMRRNKSASSLMSPDSGIRRKATSAAGGTESPPRLGSRSSLVLSDGEKSEFEEGPLVEMPPEVVSRISKYLTLPDLLAFRGGTVPICIIFIVVSFFLFSNLESWCCMASC